MSTNARTWFYEEPEHDAYAVMERLNATFWAARIGQILITACTQAEPPFKCRGQWRDEPFELEWVPRQKLILRGSTALTELIPQITRILGKLKPAFRYQTAEGWHVYEWHVGKEQQQLAWQQIQGVPAYERPERLGT